jgi:WD40 repeat protein
MMVLSRRPTIYVAFLLTLSVCLAAPLAAQDQKKDPPPQKDDKKPDVKKEVKKPDDKKIDKKKDDKKVEPIKVEPARPDLTKEKRDSALLDIKGHTGWINRLELSADGKLILSASRDRTIKIWELATGKEVQTFKDNPTNTWAAVFIEGDRIAGSTGQWNKEKKAWEGEIRIWDLAGKKVNSFKGHNQEIRCLAVSKDGKFLASGSEDHSIIVWDLATGKDIRTIKAHQGNVYGLAFSPDGKSLASAGEDKAVRVWDLTGKQVVKTPDPVKKDEPKKDEPKKDEPKKDEPKKKKDGGPKAKDSPPPPEKLDTPIQEFKGPGRDFTCVAFSPDGKNLAAGNLEGLVKVWDLAGNKEIAELKTTEGVLSIAFSRDGSKIAAGSWDWAIRVYDVKSGKQLKLIHAHQNTVSTLAFTADGRIVSGGLDNLIKIWDLSKIERVEK